MRVTLTPEDAERWGVTEVEVDEVTLVAALGGGAREPVAATDGEQLSAYEVQLWSRTRWLLSRALAEMPADDLQARIAWCQATGWWGWWRAQGLESTAWEWGGRVLLDVPHKVFSEDSWMEEPATVTRLVRPDGTIEEIG